MKSKPPFDSQIYVFLSKNYDMSFLLILHRIEIRKTWGKQPYFLFPPHSLERASLWRSSVLL